MAEESKPYKKIRHLVLSGGGGTGLAYYGALRESNKDGFWHIDDIQTVHGVSCGAIFLMLIVLLPQIGWDDYDDFCIKRPWETVLQFSPDRLLNAFANVGICSREDIVNAVLPLLKAADLTVDSTLKDLYELNGIETHFYATNFDAYELVDVSHKTHPEWTIIDALYSSAALPLLFRPNVVDGVRYVDGGFLCNYPLNPCLAIASDPDEIFGLNKVSPPREDNDTPDTNYSNIMEYIGDIIAKTMHKLSATPAKIRHTMNFWDGTSNILGVYSAIKTRESRATKIQEGAEAWSRFKTEIGWISSTFVTDCSIYRHNEVRVTSGPSAQDGPSKLNARTTEFST